jgi:hypothetical protein
MERLLNRFFFILLPVLLGLSLSFNIYTSGQNKKLLEQTLVINKQLQTLNEQQQKSLKTTQNDIRDLKDTLLCIGTFFNQTDRQDLKITTYSPCVIENTSTGEIKKITFSQYGIEAGSSSELLVDRQEQSSLRTSSSNSSPQSNRTQSDNSQNVSDLSQGPSNQPNILERMWNATISLVMSVF